MKNRIRNLLAVLVMALIPNLQPTTARAQGTTFTYQGQLQSNGGLASGTYNLEFSLYTNSTAGTPVAGPVTNSAVVITNGLFTVAIDFGSTVWNGETNWLQIGVETNGAGGFTPLSPRQELTPAPYAIYAEGSSAAGLSGTIPMSSLSGTYGGAVNLTSGANSFTGNGAGLVNVNASLLGGLASSNFWQTTGNAGTTPGLNFIGTPDNQPLELHVNSLRALRLEPGAGTNYAPNVIAGSPSNSVPVGVMGATISGGGEANFFGIALPNLVSTNFGTVGGGVNNRVTAPYSTIGGGSGNSASGNYTTVGGGVNNSAEADYATVGGGNNNFAFSQDSTVSGGFANFASGEYAAAGGGYENYATGAGAFIGGGGYDGATTAGNAASGNASVIGGGLQNTANQGYTTVGGGYNNTSSAYYATVAGGAVNTAGGYGATVDGGIGNIASGSEATVPGGYENEASGYASFAAGTYAQAVNDDCFVWSDGSVDPFASTAVNQFLIQATGGVGINTASPEQALSINGGMDIDLGNGNNGTAFNNGTAAGTSFTFGSSSGEGIASQRTSGVTQYDLAFYTAFAQRLVILNNGNVGIGTIPGYPLEMASGAYCSPAGNWTSVSDRNAKKHFTAINSREVLDKVSALPITEWQYKAEPDGMRHMGPMAQDFHAAFGLNGSDDKHISTMDEGGVALAAIQGLNQKLNEKDAEIEELKQQNQALEKRLDKLAQAIDSLTEIK